MQASTGTPGTTNFGDLLTQACIAKGDKIHTVPAKEDGVKNVVVAKPEAPKPTAKKQSVQKKVAGSAEPRPGRKAKPAEKPPVKVARKQAPKQAVKLASKNVRVPQAPHPFIPSRKDVEVMSHEAMQAEMHAFNVAAEQVTATKPAEKATKKPVAKTGGQKASQAPRVQKPTQGTEAKSVNAIVAPKASRHLVEISQSKAFVLSFLIPRKFVPENIQVIPASGGGSSASVEGEVLKRTSIGATIVDMKGLMSRVHVDSINITERQGTCVVYVNCIPGQDKEGNFGFCYWKGPYENFVRKSMERKFGKSAVKETEGKIKLDLKYSSDEPPTMLFFAVKH